MKRKVNKVGTSTLTISLPSKWCKEHNLNKGDELDVSFDESSILLSVGERAGRAKEVSLNIDDFSYVVLAKYLMMLYRFNVNKITLIYSKNEILYDKSGSKVNLKNTIKKLSDRLVGAELVSQTSTKSEIHCFLSSERKDIDVIGRRVYFLMKETMEEIINAIGKDFGEFNKTMYDHHDNITKFINYFLRELDSSDKSAYEKKQLFAFFLVIDKITDKLRHVCEKIDKFGCSDKCKKFLKELFDTVCEEFDAVFKHDFPKELIIKRYNLLKRLKTEKFSVDELNVLCEVNIFLDLMNDCYEATLANKISDGSIGNL